MNTRAPSQWEIDYSLSLSMQGPGLLDPVSSFISFPFDIGLRQKLVQMRTSHRVSEVTDEFGNVWLTMGVHSDSEVKFKYKARVKLEKIIYDWSAFQTSWPAPNPSFLKSESGIEHDAPSVRSLARQIKALHPVDVVREAFVLVRDTLTYKIQKEEYGAAYAAITKQGDCTEFSSLFAAILRVHGIGARINVGYLSGKDLHAVAEVFMGGIWVPIDVTNLPTPFLGMNNDFITLMRTNWMAPGGMGKLISFYYKTNRAIRPRMKNRATVTPVQPVKVKLLEETKGSRKNRKLPYPFPGRSSSLPFRADVLSHQKHHRVTLCHECSFDRSMLLILKATNRIIRVIPFLACPGRQIVWHFDKEELFPYFENTDKIDLLVMDQTEHCKSIGWLHKTC